jgi:hypothetical protein
MARLQMVHDGVSTLVHMGVEVRVEQAARRQAVNGAYCRRDALDLKHRAGMIAAIAVGCLGRDVTVEYHCVAF